MKEEKLLGLLRKKRGFFEAMLELTQQEGKLSLHDWISSLEQKKILLSCVDEVDSQIGPFQAMMNTLSQEISEELEAIRQVVQKILHLDNLNQENRKSGIGFYLKKD